MCSTRFTEKLPSEQQLPVMSVFRDIILVAICAVYVTLTDPVQGTPFVPNLYSATCGSDGKVYSNFYELKYEACIQGVTITNADPKTCPDFPDNYLFPFNGL
ncbi:hypothetical protein RRG08_061661 [Elysia crispata]|uniref:Uncharacterized protein n=1 Tax=Elysia crispata TaxID=231223 RepID=A0AAE0Z510_9GAST|nr:hypothetical protein RRG08_061661 [Elysia crispata]